MTSVAHLPQSLSAAALHAGSNHYVLHADQRGARRKHCLVADDVVETRPIVSRALCGKEGQPVIPVAQVLHGKSRRVIVRHDGRFGKHRSHCGAAPSSSLIALREQKQHETGPTTIHKPVTIGSQSRFYDSYAYCVIRDGYEAVNSAPESTS